MMKKYVSIFARSMVRKPIVRTFMSSSFLTLRKSLENSVPIVLKVGNMEIVITQFPVISVVHMFRHMSIVLLTFLHVIKVVPCSRRFPLIQIFLEHLFSVLSRLICLITPPKYILRLLNVSLEKSGLFPYLVALFCRITQIAIFKFAY